MKKSKSILLSILMLSSIMLTACSTGNDTNINSQTSTTTGESTNQSVQDTTQTSADIKLDEDDYYFDWKNSDYKTYNLSEESVNITSSGIYHITGATTTNNITINVDKETDKDTIFLILDNISITSDEKTPIDIIQGKKITIILENGTTNTITQNVSDIDNTQLSSAAIHSKADLSLTGSGTLNITTNYNDGLKSNDDLIITDGIFNINAQGDGIVAKDVLYIENGSFDINSGKDALKTNNEEDETKGNLIINNGTFKLAANGDGIDSVNAVTIENGTFNISSGGGYTGVSKQSTNGGRGMFTPESATNATTTDTTSQKAIKAATTLTINNGSFNISSNEDAIHSNSNIIINNGSYSILAGDDGMHADGTLTINGGDIAINNSYEGLEANNITFANAKISIVSSDDGINVASTSGTLTINSGNISIVSGGDGVDSNGNIVLNGGDIIIDTSNIQAADSAVDYDGTLTGSGYTIKDQNGNEITPTQGMGGGMAGGARPNRGDATMPDNGTAQQAVPPTGGATRPTKPA